MAGKGRFESQRRVALEGSERKPYAGEVEPTEPVKKGPRSTGKVTVSVIVRPKEAIKFGPTGRPQERLSRAGYAAKHGADPASVKVVRAFAKEFGLTMGEIHPGRRTVHLSGSAAAMQKAFGVELTQQKTDKGTFRVREGTICLPEELNEHVTAVLGLDNRPQAKPHFRVRGVATPNAANISYTPVQVGELYGFPKGAKATGQTIGIIELGGGYRTADLTAYFKTLGLPAPTVTAVSVDGGKNSPSNASSADGEVMLDIEVSAAIATGAKVVVYFTPNTDQGFQNAISTAVHDTKNKPSVVSISWGGPESTWTSQAMNALDEACQAAASVGVTITVAAGDNGATDGVAGTALHVDFPASSPCGGTKLNGSGTTITSEVVWNELANNEGATGGGVSQQFGLPAWQANSKVPKSPSGSAGRGVPDVTGDADPTTGYDVRVDGQTMVIGGTSAVAPLWAGLIALANQQNGADAGFINPALYAAGVQQKAFHDITQGNNDGYTAGPGWDACSGQGSPIGTAVIPVVAPAASGAGAGGSGTAVKSKAKKGSKTAAGVKTAAKKAAGKKVVSRR
jgi:kumamolisin